MLLDQIAKKDVPTQYAIWWINVTQLQCINAWQFDCTIDCAKSIAQKLKIPVTSSATNTTIETIQYNNGVYVGEVVNGKRNGKGKYTWTNGDVYEGDFVNDKRTGKGTYTWTNGDVYEGDFVDGDFVDGNFVNTK